MAGQLPANILKLTAQILSAHAAHSSLAHNELSPLIQAVYLSLSTAGAFQPPHAPAVTPSVPIKKSVFPDYIVCLEDGKKLKMLKRHLQSRYGLSPEAYRVKWGLPTDYPMVAPAIAAKRSDLAKKSGLGASRWR